MIETSADVTIEACKRQVLIMGCAYSRLDATWQLPERAVTAGSRMREGV